MSGLLDNKELDRLIAKADAIAKKANTVASLIEAGELRLHGDVITADKGVVLETIYGNNATVTICKATYKSGRVADHIHENVTQYLICVKGMFNINMPGGHRILTPSACASIPPNVEHSVTALEDDSELVAVCVPEEKVYKKSMQSS